MNLDLHCSSLENLALEAGWQFAIARRQDDRELGAEGRDAAQKPFTFIMLFVFAKQDGKWVSGGDAYTVGEFPTAR